MSLEAVRQLIHNPIEPDIEDAAPPPDEGGRPPVTMPDGCPVIPVGTEDGIFYFITALGELRGLSPDKVSNNHIKAMFAPDIRFLYEVERWQQRKLVVKKGPDGKPLTDDEGNQVTEWIVTGIKTQQVTEDLLDACAAKGVWNAEERVRGRGAWKDERGGLILHCGNKVLIGGRWVDPGLIEGLVYPTQPAIPRPIAGRGAGASAVALAPELAGALIARGEVIGEWSPPADLLLGLLRTWNWARPDLDPMLLLGWIGAALVGGALDYRPLAWITGDAASGKTSLQKLMAWLFDGGMVQSPEASEAGVRQRLGQQSLPVGLDEAEASGDNRKIKALITLARLAATSQGNLLRGGQDHKSVQFRADSCFLFSSILIPPLDAADRSRIALLELGELPPGSRSPISDRHRPEINAIGAWLRRRIADRWSQWPRLLEQFQDALIAHGEQGGRAADQFGTLRAMAHLLLFDDPPDAVTLKQAGEDHGRKALAETREDAREGPLCLDYLLSSLVALERGGTLRTVAHWVWRAAAPDPIAATPIELGDHRAGCKQANASLGAIGLRVIERRKTGERFLAIADRHQGLARVFDRDDCKYGGGVWAQALRRLPGAIKDSNQTIDHRDQKCTLVPIALVINGREEELGHVAEMVEA